MGIAVPVAADPAANFHKSRKRKTAIPAEIDRIFNFTVKPRQLFEKRRGEVSQAVVDFIAHREGQLAQNARLPECKDRPPQVLLIVGSFVRRQWDAVALVEQGGNMAKTVRNTLTLHFGWMR